jgi:hypothetical protein
LRHWSHRIGLECKDRDLRPVPVIVSEQEIDFLLTENAGAIIPQ